MLKELKHGLSSPRHVVRYLKAAAASPEPARPRPLLNVLFAVVLVALLSVAQAPTASAHAFVVSSSPQDGATLDRAPANLTLTFDEDVLLASGSVTLRSDDGIVLLHTGPPVGASAVGGEAGPELIVGLPALGKGTYSATWSVGSADDLHQTTGTVSFAVGQAYVQRAVERDGPPPPVLGSLLEWLDVTGIALLLGAILLLVSALPRSQMSPGDEATVRAFLWRVITVTALAELLLGVTVVISSVGVNDILGGLTSTRPGRLWLLRETLLAATSVSALLAIRRKGLSRSRTIVTGALMVGSLAAVAGSSHVGVGADKPFAELLLVVHLSSAGAWAGAVLLLLVLVALERAGGAQLPSLALLRSFGAPAAYCVAVASLSGIALAARQVASVDALLTTTYGQILIVKVLAVLAAGWLGFRTTIRLRRSRLSSVAVLYRGVALESAALLLILAAGGALSVGTPARGPAFAPRGHPGPAVVSAQLGDLLESATLAPNAVGRSWLRVDVSQTRRPVRAPLTGVTASLRGPDSSTTAARPLARTEIANRWELADVSLTAAGTWQLTITTSRAGLPDTVWRASWIVQNNPAAARKPLVSDRSWETLLNHIALGMALLTVASGLVAWWIGHRRHRPNAQPPEPSLQSEERTPARRGSDLLRKQ